MKSSFSQLICLLISFCMHAQGNVGYSAWIAQANSFYKEKKYLNAANAYSKAFETLGGKAYAEDRYNAACAWALAGNKDSAFFHLERLVSKTRYTDIRQLQDDADMESLHSDKRWTALCMQVKENKDKAEANINKALARQLDTIFESDQKYRKKLDNVQEQYGANSQQMRALADTINYCDSVNVIKVIAILDKYGWPGPDVAGERGNAAMFYVIQHANIAVQEKYLPVLQEAVKHNAANPAWLAMLEDRINYRHGRRQVYGSQILADVNGKFLSPLEDPDNVDKRRAEVGLEPMAEYLQNFGMTWNLEEYKKQLPDLEKRLKIMYPH